MPTPSKGVRLHRKLVTKEIIELRKQRKSWTRIGIIVCMDRNNVRRAYLKFNQSNSDNLAQQGVTR